MGRTYNENCRTRTKKMNERIEELYKQSFIEVQDENSFPCMTFSKQKFAELIVRECMDQVWYTREDGINGNVSEVIKDRIKKHFGVEE